MYAAALRSDEPAEFDPLASIRSRGVVALEARAESGATRRATVRESGALRLRFPKENPARLDAVVVNVAGGMAGGDVYDLAFAAAPGADLLVSSSAAEKVYRALAAPTRANVRLRAEARARLVFVPQEAILFNGARIARTFEIDVDPQARLIAADAVTLGRAAMGETVTSLVWKDFWRLRRDGRLIFADAARVEGDCARILAAPATGGGARAFGTLLYAACDAADSLEALRATFADARDCECGATLFDGLVLARFAAPDAQPLRAALAAALTSLPGGSPPRSWST